MKRVGFKTDTRVAHALITFNASLTFDTRRAQH